MGKTKVTDFFAYRHRYMLGYVLLTVVVVSLLFVVGVLSPGGISNAEKVSTVASDTLTPLTTITEAPAHIVDAPYHLLQKATINTLGVSALSIKLPSLILAGLAIFALHGLLRLWFRRNVALITSVISVSTGLFLFTAQEGTPAITYFFLNVTLLWAVSMLTRDKKASSLWLILAAIVAACSLYSPLQIYVVLGLMITCIVHPHARFVVFRRSAWAILGAGIAFALIVAPLVIAAVLDPSIIKPLLGIPESAAIFSSARLEMLFQEYLGFWKPLNGSFIAPAYGLGLILLAMIGLYRLLTAKYTAKSYILTIWLVLTIPIIIFVPESAGFTLLPIVLLLAFAIDYLIRSWYRLFPYNPYARVAGLLPLAVLMVGLSVPCVERMVYGYHYSPDAASVYTKDLSLLDNQKGILLVPPNDKRFYEVYSKHRQDDNRLIVISSLSDLRSLQAVNSQMTLIAERSFKPAIPATPNKILVSSTTNESARFYLYTDASL